MKNINKLERIESRRIGQIAAEYRKNGYTVIIQPSLNELPSFLSHYQPDIIAKGTDESVIIEVKSHSNLYKSSQVSQIAEIVESQPGWRFDLVMVNPKGNTLTSSESRLPNVEELSRRLTKAKRLVSRGYYEAALSTAWSAAEGLFRLIGKNENIILDRQSSSYVLKKIYSLGLIDNTSYQELSSVYKMRNSVVHGFIEPNLESDILLSFITTVRKILKNYRRKLMRCKCPVCGKQTAHVGTLFSHLLNIHDRSHETWLESYCAKNSINFGKLLIDRMKGKKDANKPLTDLLKRDFCTDD